MDDAFVQVHLGEVKNIPLHRFPGLEFFFLVRGSAELEVDGERYTMEAEDIILCHSGNLRAMHSDVPNVVLRILLPEAYLRSEADIADTSAFFCNSVSARNRNSIDFFELRRIITRLMFAYFGDRDEARLEAKSLLFQLLLLMKTVFYDAAAVRRKEVPANVDERIADAISYIERNFRNQITLQDIAEYLGFSVHYLSRLFKRQVGMGYLEYLGDVRLKNAVAELVSTNESILKVAMNNGFANATSFNKLFHKRFGMSPVKYRAQHQKDEDTQLLRVDNFEPQSGDPERELLRYLVHFDVRRTAEKGERRKYVVDMSAPAAGKVNFPEKIVKVGRLAELLKSEVREQLEDVKEKLGFRRIHFRAFFGDGMYRYGDLSFHKFYEYELAISYMLSLSLKPIFQIDVAAFFAEAEKEDSAEVCYERLDHFMGACAARWGTSVLSEWSFELYGREVPNEAFFPLYQRIRGIVTKYSTQIRFGVSSLSSPTPTESDRFAQFLDMCVRTGTAVDFVTIHAYPFKQFELRDDRAYLAFRTYFQELISLVHDLAEPRGFRDLPVLVMDWNTLTGADARADFYYRTAVILDAILSIRECAQGMGFWLNSHIYESLTGQVDNTILAIFLQLWMKRPIYYVLTLLIQVRDEEIYLDENLIVTKDAKGVYTVLANNPCYFNPAYATDEKYLETQSKIVELELQNWNGAYIFERYILDRNNGAIYNKWAEMGFPSLFRPEVSEYLGMVVKPNFSMYEEHVAGSVAMFQEMEFNAILFYVIKPIQI